MEQIIGCDAHKKFSIFVAVDEKGKASKPVRVEHQREVLRAWASSGVTGQSYTAAHLPGVGWHWPTTTDYYHGDHLGGADIRYIQAILGHEDLKTTQIYTQVAIRTLKQIHAATHPAAMLDKTQAPPLPHETARPADPLAEELFAVLHAEAEEEVENQ